MFCRKCGKEIDDEAVVCIGCGCSVEEKPKNTEDNENQTTIGILMGLFLGLIGLIIGLCLYKSDTIARKTFMKAWGITFGICAAVSIIIYVVYFAIVLGLMGGMYSMLLL